MNSEPSTDAFPLIDILQLAGLAAVRGRDLYGLWNPPASERYFSDWMRYRIAKFGLQAGTHYVTYRQRADQRHHYLLSLPAARTLALGEVKGQGQALARDLDRYRRALRRQGLPGRGKLTDLIELAQATTRPQPALGVGAIRQEPAPDHHWPDGALTASDLPEEVTLEAIGAESSAPKREIGEPTGLPPADLEQRLAELEATVQQLVRIQQVAARQYLGLHRSKEPLPEQPLRSKIRQLVNTHCGLTGAVQEEAYKWIYNRLYYLFGVNIRSYQRQSTETYLEVAERQGHLDKVYAIVSSQEFGALSAHTRPSDAAPPGSGM